MMADTSHLNGTMIVSNEVHWYPHRQVLQSYGEIAALVTAPRRGQRSVRGGHRKAPGISGIPGA